MLFRKVFFAALVGLAVASGASTGFAQGNPDIVARLEAAVKDDPAMAAYLRTLGRQVARGRDQAVRSAMQQLYEIGPRGVVSPEEIGRYTAKQQARQRGNLVGRYLAWDLNADGAISASERSAFEGREGAELAMLFADGDKDADGAVDPAELLAYASAQTEARVRDSKAHYLMLYDVDQDGRVTADEVLMTIDALAAAAPETTGQTSPRPFPAQRAQLSCDAPDPSEDADVVVLTGYEGAALSTTSIAGMDGVTHVGRVEIEPGDKPLYVFLSAYANMIWDVSGDTGRISALVVQRSRAGTTAGAGVIGVPQDKIHFVDVKTCMNPVSSMKGTKAVLAYRRAGENLGRDPDVMVATYTIDSVALPSGDGSKAGVVDEGRDIIIYGGRRYEFTPEGPRLLDETGNQPPGEQPFGAQRVYREMLRFNSSGLRAIDPETVIAPGEAVAYDVMPQQAGLLQLLLEEKLRYTRDGYFRIEQPIARFPAGLNGAHSVKFILAEGVPMPGGSPGHSQVYSAETGDCIVGMRCGR